jgi:hypothetical protein
MFFSASTVVLQDDNALMHTSTNEFHKPVKPSDAAEVLISRLSEMV